MKRFLALLCTVATTLTLVGCNDAAPSTSSDSVNKQDEDMVNESQGNEGRNNGLSGILGEDNGIFEEEAPTGMILTINGNEYDLTSHFYENVISMVKNDITVMDYNDALSWCYDENGTFHTGIRALDLSDEESASRLYVTQIEQQNSPATHTYFISNLYDNSLEFETLNGITNGFTASDIKSLEGFVSIFASCTFARVSEWAEADGEYACAALYVDGKMIDISQYERDAETWLAEPDSFVTSWLREGESQVTIMPPTYFKPLAIFSSSYAPSPDTFTGPEYEMAKHVAMLHLAIRDAYWDMVDGNAECICLISYIYTEEEAVVSYQLYGADFTPQREWLENME